MSLKVIDKMPSFISGNYGAMDRSLNRMAIDIERLSKEQVPVLKGQLRSSGKHRRIGPLKYVMEYLKEYARFQEFGGDGKRTVRHYTYPGKKAFYLRDSAQTIVSKAISYFKSEAERIKV